MGAMRKRIATGLMMNKCAMAKASPATRPVIAPAFNEDATEATRLDTAAGL